MIIFLSEVNTAEEHTRAEKEKERGEASSHFSILSFRFSSWCCNANLLITGLDIENGSEGQVTLFSILLLLQAPFVCR